jgi:hypothetical protein
LKFDAVRERMRNWYCGASDKSGRKRGELDVEGCFAPLPAWVLKDRGERHLAIALDVTTPAITTLKQEKAPDAQARPGLSFRQFSIASSGLLPEIRSTRH